MKNIISAILLTIVSHRSPYDNHGKTNKMIGQNKNILQYIIKKGLFRTIVLCFLAISLIPLIIITGITYKHNYKFLTKTAAIRLTRAATLKSNQIHHFFHDSFSALFVQARSNNTISLLKNLDASFKASKLSPGEFIQTKQWKYIVKQYEQDMEFFLDANDLYDLLIIDSKGNILFTDNQTKNLGANVFISSDSLFNKACQDAFNREMPVFSGIEKDRYFNNLMTGYLITLIFDKNKKKIGIAAVQFTSDIIDKIIQSTTGLDDQGEIYLIDEQFRMISSSSKENSFRILSPVKSTRAELWFKNHVESACPLVAMGKPSIYTNYKNIKVLGLHRNIITAGKPLAIITEIPENLAFRQAIMQKNTAFFVLGVTAFIVIVMAFIIANKITMPISELSAITKKITAGSTDHTIDIKSNNEIGELAENFRTMIKRQQETEKILQKSEERFRGIVDSMADWVWEIDSNGCYTFCSEKIENILGYSQDEVIGKTPFDFMVPDQVERLRKIFSQIAEEKKPIKNLENWNLSKDGQRLCILTNGIPILNKNGNLLGFRGVDTDITKQKKIQEKIQEASDNFNNVYYNSFSAISTIDGDKFIDCNDALVTMLNADNKDNVLNTHPSDLSPEKQPDGKNSFEKANKMIKIAFEKGFNNFEWVHKKVTGQEFPVAVSLTRIKHKNKPVLHCLWKDLSEEKKMIDNLNKAKKEAMAASKAKSEFLANMSHEIRTPMNGVIGMTDLLFYTDLNDTQLKYATIIKNSGESLLTLINDILDFSKISAGKLDIEEIDFDLRNLMDDFAATMSFKIEEKGLELICSTAPDLPQYFKGDPGRIRQILTNLAGNAIKFTEKGEIFVSCRLEEEFKDTYKLYFSVKDTGIGIPKKNQAKLFEQFTQADNSITRQFGGTGLGLTISKKLSELMNGEIGINSTEGKGSTFWFTLILKKSEKKAEPVMTGDLTKAKILVVDDNATNLKLIGTMLSSWDINHSLSKEDTKVVDILYKAVENRTPFDIVIIDMHMPGKTSLNICKKIKKDDKLKHTHLIVLTSLANRGDAGVYKDIGCSAFLTKPIRQSDLYDCLSQIMGISTENKNKHEAQLITRHTINENRKIKTRILLVEDNLINRKVATAIFKKIGYNTDLAVDGMDALEKLESEPYDIVFMDLQMPRMGGFEATKKIRQGKSHGINHKIPIIAMTANAMKGDREKCLKAGMDDYLSKPIKVEAILGMINKWLPKTT